MRMHPWRRNSPKHRLAIGRRMEDGASQMDAIYRSTEQIISPFDSREKG
jgi:hypothetical protein